MKSSEKDKFSKKKAETSLLTREEVATGHSRRAEESGGGGGELGGAEGSGWKIEPTQFCPAALPSKDPSA